MKRAISLLISLIIFLFFCTRIKAQVLINEFSSGSTSDWVELYNIGTVSADLSVYKLTDSGTNDKILSGSITAGGFASFSFSNWLNNAGDGVKLYNGSTLVDSIYYGGDGQVCAPSDSGSVGRYPDGGNTIDRFLSSTRDSSNNSSTLDPCPTPTISPTPTPTPTPTSTPAPTSSPSPTIQSTISPTKSPTPKPTKSPVPQVLGDETNTSSSGTNVSDLRNTLFESDSPSPASSPERKTSPPFLAIGLIITGIGVMGVAGFLAFKKQKENSSGTINE